MSELVTYQTDYEFGVKTKFVKGIPISFTRLSDREIESYYRRLARVDEEEE